MASLVTMRCGKHDTAMLEHCQPLAALNAGNWWGAVVEAGPAAVGSVTMYITVLRLLNSWWLTCRHHVPIICTLVHFCNMMMVCTLVSERRYAPGNSVTSYNHHHHVTN
jgi:hypothetical protein